MDRSCTTFFNVKVQVGKKLLALHVTYEFWGKTKRPPKLHYRFCTKQLNVDMWQPRKHKPDLPKLAKLMHQGHQDSWELFVSQSSYVTSEAERFQASKKISSKVSIQLPMTARVKILKIWWTSSLCKLSGNTQIAAFTSPHSFPLWKLLF